MIQHSIRLSGDFRMVSKEDVWNGPIDHCSSELGCKGALMAAFKIFSFYFFCLHSIIFVLKLSIIFGRVFITSFRFPGHQHKIRHKGHLALTISSYFSITYSLSIFDTYLHSYLFRSATSGPQKIYIPTNK